MMRTIATAALRAGITSNEMLARWVQCYLEDVPALLREEAPHPDDDEAIARLAEKYGANAWRLFALLATAAEAR